jgi:DNA repair ATPase RecN
LTDFSFLVKSPAQYETLTTYLPTQYVLRTQGDHAVFGLVKKVQRMLAAQDGKSKLRNPMDILAETYQDLSTLAEQISSHAERAPYPHMAERLRQMAAEKRASANLLRAKLDAYGKTLEETPREIKSGQNHWERMAQDLNDQRSLETKLFDRAALLNEKTPELAELLRQIAAAQRPHVAALLDLIARADPQADQT